MHARTRLSPILAVALVTLCTLCGIQGCVFLQRGGEAADTPALEQPLTIMDGADFAVFSKRFRPLLITRHILNSDGTPAPQTPLTLHGTTRPSGEYLPESFGSELYNRLSLRFMWPAEERNRQQEVLTHASMPSSGETVTIDPSSVVVVGEFSTDIYKLVALMDWDGDGTRDWLVRYRFKPSTDEPASSRLLVIPSPAPLGLLEAEVIEAVECSADGCISYTGGALTNVLGYDPKVPVPAASMRTTPAASVN